MGLGTEICCYTDRAAVWLFLENALPRVPRARNLFVPVLLTLMQFSFLLGCIIHI